MPKKNLLLEYSEQLSISIITLCKEYKIDFNTSFQIKKSSSSVFAKEQKEDLLPESPLFSSACKFLVPLSFCCTHLKPHS